MSAHPRLHVAARYACIAVLSSLASLASLAPLAAQYDPDAAEPIPRFRGTFFLGGGGELPAEVMDQFVQVAGGTSAHLVVLATSNHGKAQRDRLARHKVKAARLLLLRADSRQAASTKDFAGPLQRATGVWIAGDKAAAFADVFQGTPVEAALRALIGRGGAIGGNGEVTRALTKVMIVGGHPQATVRTGLDLVPGAVLDDQYTSKNRRNRLLGVLAAQPALVGLGIDADTAMVMQHRFFDVLGKGSVYGCVSANEKRPLRIDRINRRESPASQLSRRRGNRPGRGTRPRGQRGRRGQRGQGQRGRGGEQRRGQRGQGQRRRGRRGRGGTGGFRVRRLGDLMALSRSAQARVASHFPGYDPRPPHVAKGTLVIVGGGGMPPGLMQRFIELAGGPEAPLVYIPCSEQEEITRAPRILQSWRRAGAKNVDWIHTKDRNKANSDEEILGKLQKARGIWFGGGRQWNLVDSYQNTTAHKLMHDVLARGGVIGGSSAGASIQASYMARGNSLGNLDSMAEGYETGLGFLTGCAVDQHFTQRGRLPDMTELVNTYPKLLGIGIDEAASILVQGSIAEVFAREGRNVLFYDRRKPVIPGEKDYTLVKNGQRYDLKNRTVLPEAVPADAASEKKKKEKKKKDADAGKQTEEKGKDKKKDTKARKKIFDGRERG